MRAAEARVGVEAEAPLVALMVRVEELAPDPEQPRRSVEGAELEELAASIAARGVIQPLLVSHHPEEAVRGVTPYMIVAGERRWAAAKRAGLVVVPVVLREDEIPAAERLMLQLDENDGELRKELSLFERVRGVALAFRLAQCRRGVFARRHGKSQSWITHYLGLAEARGPVVEAMREGHVQGVMAAVLLSGMPAAEQQLLLDSARHTHLPITARTVEAAGLKRARLIEKAERAREGDGADEGNGDGGGGGGRAAWGAGGRRGDRGGAATEGGAAAGGAAPAGSAAAANGERPAGGWAGPNDGAGASGHGLVALDGSGEVHEAEDLDGAGRLEGAGAAGGSADLGEGEGRRGFGEAGAPGDLGGGVLDEPDELDEVEGPEDLDEAAFGGPRTAAAGYLAAGETIARRRGAAAGTGAGAVTVVMAEGEEAAVVRLSSHQLVTLLLLLDQEPRGGVADLARQLLNCIS